jgi:hypothetical protein
MRQSTYWLAHFSDFKLHWDNLLGVHMLKTASQGQRAEGNKAKFDVEIASVATAVPAHKICQAEITKRAREVFPHLAQLESLYGNTGIETRYPARRRIGITNAMDGKRVPRSSSTMRLPCWRR